MATRDFHHPNGYYYTTEYLFTDGPFEFKQRFDRVCTATQDSGWTLTAHIRKGAYFATPGVVTFTGEHPEHGKLTFRDQVMTADSEAAIDHFLTKHELGFFDTKSVEGYDGVSHW